jgi:O-antigen/teichoic acid export membrane protein
MSPPEHAEQTKQDGWNGGSQAYRQLLNTFGHWSLILIGLISTNVFSGLSIIILARRVTPFEYGQYIAIFSLAVVTSVLPNLGLTGWILSQPEAARRFGRRFWYATAGPRLRALTVWAILLWIIGLFLPEETYPATIMAPVLVGVLFDSILMFGYSFLRVRDHHGIVTIFQTVAGLALLALVLFAPLVPGQLWNFAMARMVISLVTVVLLAVYIHHQAPADPTTDGEEPLRGGLRKTAPYLFADAASTIYIKADITIVGIYIGAHGASLYGPASNVLTMTFLISQALFFFVIPQLARLHNRDQANFKRGARKQLLLQVGAGLAVSISLFLLTPLLVPSLFGAEYADSIPLLQLLSIIPALRSITVGLAAVLMAAQRQPERTVVQVVAAIFNVGANLLIIEQHGLQGVVWVFIITEVLIVLGHVYLVAGGHLQWRERNQKEATT